MRLAVLFALALATTPAAATEIRCEGLFGPNSTLADIEKAYGKANVVTGDVDGPEGDTIHATTVFPNDEDKTFRIYWRDDEKNAGISSFTVARADTGPGGIRIGMPIADVQKINGAVFTLSGFYWDYGGSAGFDSGKLAKLAGACFLNLGFAPSIDPPNDKISEAISGEQDLKSNMKEFAIVKPVVGQINLSYPDPDEGSDDSGDATSAD